MNAHALLTSQGWRGTGHSLHPTSDTTGLSRPLLVSSKNNTLGVGKKQHKTSDMWWMNAFDKTLKGLDTSTEGKVVQTMTSGGLDMVVKGGAKFVGNGGGLYASFVRGEVLGGTLEEKIPFGLDLAVKEFEMQSLEPPAKKRKTREGERESKEERRARKAAKRTKKAQLKAEDLEEADIAETREDKIARRTARRERKAQKACSKKISRSKATDDESPTIETREERKVRRRQKKLLKSMKEENGIVSFQQEKKKKCWKE